MSVQGPQRGHRKARLAPEAQRGSDQAAAGNRLLDRLKDDYGVVLSTVPRFLVVVEGTTDKAYLRRAAELHLAATGVNLLELRVDATTVARVEIAVPGEPGKPGSGGADRVVAMGRDLSRDFFLLDVPSGLVFVLDHDWAGREARDNLKKYGYKAGIHIMTVDPREHPGSCGGDEGVIEDLLSIQLQMRFFDVGSASCDFEYRGGVLKRIRWLYPSKADLRTYATQHASVADLSEVIRLLERVAAQLGTPNRPAPTTANAAPVASQKRHDREVEPGR